MVPYVLENYGEGEGLKLVSYSTGGGTPHIGYVEDSEIHSLGGSSMMEYIEHGRSADRRPGGETVSRRRGCTPR